MIEQFLIRQSVLGSVTNMLLSAGTLSSNRSDVTFADSNGVTFGLNTNGVITASVAGGAGAGSVNISAGTTSIVSTAFTFSNSNGVSWGINTNAVITATVVTTYAGQGFTTATTAGTAVVGTLSTNGLSMGVPAYLTTAALSQDSSKYAGTGFTTATTAGTAVVGTLSTNGLSMGVPAYLTTAALSQDSSKYAGTGFTTATTAGTNIVGTLATNGISMGVPAYLTTAMQSNAATISNINISAGTTSTNGSAFTFSNLNNVSFGIGTGANTAVVTASIATTYAGTGFTTATTAGTAVVGTLNTSGLSLGIPAYLTTAALSQDSSKYAGTGFTTATTAGTAIVGTLATNGLSMGVPAYLTTAMQSNAATISNIKISAGTLSQTRSDVTFADSNGVSWGLNTNGVVTASIATTYAGTGFTTATTAGTAIVGTLNTSGLSMGVPAYITTADLSQNSSNYAGTAGAITGGSITVNTSGVSVKVPIATLSLFENIPVFQGTGTKADGFSRVEVIPFVLPQVLSAGYLRLLGSISVVSSSATGTTANTSFTFNRSISTAFVIYTQGTGASSLSLQYLTSTVGSWMLQMSITAGATGSRYTCSFNITYPIQGTTSLFQTNFASSQTQYDIQTGSLSDFNGARFIDIPFANSLSPGNYWLGLGSSTNSASNAGPAALNNALFMFSNVIVTQATTVYGFPGAATNVSNQMVPGLGSWTTNAAVMTTSSLRLADISFNTVNNVRQPFQFIRQA